MAESTRSPTSTQSRCRMLTATAWLPGWRPIPIRNIVGSLLREISTQVLRSTARAWWCAWHWTSLLAIACSARPLLGATSRPDRVALELEWRDQLEELVPERLDTR